MLPALRNVRLTLVVAWMAIGMFASGISHGTPSAGSRVVTSLDLTPISSPIDSTRRKPGWLADSKAVLSWDLSPAWNPNELCFTLANNGEGSPFFWHIEFVPLNAQISSISGTAPGGTPLTTGNGYCYPGTTGPGAWLCYGPGGPSGTSLRVCGQLTNTGPTTSVTGWAYVNQGAGPVLAGSNTWMYPSTRTWSISKFEDFNGNGTRDPGDTPLGGNTFFWDVNDDGQRGAGELFGTANSDGVASIPGVDPSGTHGLREESTPSSWVTYPAGGVHQVNASDPGSALNTYLFGNFRKARVRGSLRYRSRGMSGASCPYGQRSNTAGTGCETSPPGSDGWFLPPSLTVSPQDGTGYDAPDWWGPTSAPVQPDGTFEAPNLPWGTFSLESGDPTTVFPNTDQATLYSGSDVTVVIDWYRYGTLRGRVGIDSNRDGVLDPTEPPLVARPVLVNWGTHSQTLETDADGWWSADDAIPGTSYTVSIDPPAGAMSAPFSESGVVESGGQYTHPYPVQMPWGLTVDKFEDRWGDGVKGPEDLPMPGVPFCVDVGANGLCDPTDPLGTTDAMGMTTVFNATPGTFFLREQADVSMFPTFPPGGQQSIDFPSLGADPDPFVFLNSRFSTVSGTIRPSRWGPLFPGPICPPGQWANADASGCEPCPTDPLNPFCSILLPFNLQTQPAAGCTHCPGAAFQHPMIPVNGGLFEFTGLVPGQYEIQSTDTKYTVFGDPIALPSGSQLTGWPLFVHTNGSTAGRVFVDANANGRFDGGDSGVPGSRLQLFEAGAAQSFFDVFTGPDGTWTPTTMAPGTSVHYEITLPPGYVTLTPRTGAFRTESGGVFDPQIIARPSTDGSVTAYKFVDFDGDGALDSFEPGLNGVTFRLVGPSGAQSEAVSADRAPGEPGYAVFTGLGPGTYTLSEVAPADFTPTVPASGSYSISITVGVPNEALHLFGNAPTALDYGDALQTADPSHVQFPWGYPVTAAANGARHLAIPGARLGDYLDIEGDGRPHFLALGDDSFPSGQPDDEDGVEFISAFTNVLLQFDPGPPDPVRIPVLAKNRTGRVVFRPSVQGRISGWIDWNRDGDWSDEDETVFRHVQVEAPTDTLFLPVPPTASPGFAYARFRFHPSARLEPTGPIVGGEVEDYLVLVSAPVPVSSTGDTPDASPGDGICADATGACTLRAALMEASAGGGVYVIDLGAAGKTGAAVFRPTSPLPVVLAPVEIVGSQAVLDGSLAGDASGLVFETSGATVYALTVQGFRRHGIVIAGSENRVWNSRFTGNGEDGIRVASGRLNMLSTNTFSGNGGLAINLVAPSDPANGVTVNDASDADAGANDLLNMPVLSLVTAENGHIQGTTGCAFCAVELHANVACDPSGYGEGDTFLEGLITLANGSFETVLPAPLALGTAVSAILRDRVGNTSEFSACMAAVASDLEIADDRDVPSGYELLQNYPNPFNPTTTIEFRVPEPARVQLVVYDLLGRPVARLADATLPPGLHSAVFDAGDLPTGLYVYRLHTPYGVLARSLVLFK